jgi:hypothetical protein
MKEMLSKMTANRVRQDFTATSRGFNLRLVFVLKGIFVPREQTNPHLIISLVL